MEYEKISLGWQLLNEWKMTYSLDGYEVIIKAYHYAKKLHEGQFRSSGEPYFIHPMRVAEILSKMNMDAQTVAAALLHDILEDTPTTVEGLKEIVGGVVTKLVQGVTNLARIKFKDREEEQTENMRRLLFAMADDVRVLLIKLADRLHNMRTLEYISRERQITNSRETLDIYAPLASRMGLSHIKCELEDACLKYLYPEEYSMLVNEVPKRLKERQQYVERVIHEIEDKLKEIGVKGTVNGRQKHLYSIYKKMISQNKSLDEIYDIIAVRVIVNEEKDCYAVLGGVHTTYKPVPGRFKDYIAMPKKNRYRSLHTTVMTAYGIPFEIQIRTFEMHQQAEYGLAAHWKYKTGGKVTSDENIDERIKWIRDVLDLQGEVNESHDFIDSIKVDLFNNEVFVFSPKSDVINLPIGATVVDFAYAIHSKVGDKCVGGKVNSKIVTLDTVLNNGDIVEILTSNNSKGPSRDWLNFVVSPSTKSKIRQFFKKSQKEDNIKIGKDMLEREAKKRNVSLSSPEAIRVFEQLAGRYVLSGGLEDIYASIGYGGLTTNQIILKLAEAQKKEETPPLLVRNEDAAKVQIKQSNQYIRENASKKAVGDILIKGITGMLIKVAKCCSPVPGDEIIGYVSRGRGVSVHRLDCPNVANFEKERQIEANWASDILQEFTATINIYSDNRDGLIAEISSLLSNAKISLNLINAKILKNGCALITVGMMLKSIDSLDYIIKRITAVRSVIKVTRI